MDVRVVFILAHGASHGRLHQVIARANCSRRHLTGVLGNDASCIWHHFQFARVVESGRRLVERHEARAAQVIHVVQVWVMHDNCRSCHGVETLIIVKLATSGNGLDPDADVSIQVRHR